MGQYLSQPSSAPGDQPRLTLLRQRVRQFAAAIWRQRVRQFAAAIWRQKVLWLGLGGFLLLAWHVGATTCVFRSTLGIPCPGCGMTRAWMDVLHGQWQDALRQHPLFWLVPPILIAWAMIRWLLPRGKAARLSQGLMIAAGVLMIAVYIIRIVLFFPHTEPMTYNHQAFVARLIRLIRALVLPSG